MLTLKYQDEPNPCQKMIQGAVYWLKGGDVKRTHERLVLGHHEKKLSGGGRGCGWDGENDFFAGLRKQSD